MLLGNDCTLETGYECSPTRTYDPTDTIGLDGTNPSQCTTICGDGIVIFTDEVCDSGFIDGFLNPNPGAGCANCWEFDSEYMCIYLNGNFPES